MRPAQHRLEMQVDFVAPAVLPQPSVQHVRIRQRPAAFLVAHVEPDTRPMMQLRRNVIEI